MMRQYCKIDREGNVLEYFAFDEYTSIPIDCKQSFEGVFHNPKYSYEMKEWVEGLTNEEIFEIKKIEKLDNLKNECSRGIIGRFLVNVDGVDYYFSCDQEAQKNFSNSFGAFKEGWITTVKWTCYDEDGNMHRVDFNKEQFTPIYIGHLVHVQSSIAKLRDYLQPMVMQAQTMEELGNIKW